MNFHWSSCLGWIYAEKLRLPLSPFSHNFYFYFYFIFLASCHRHQYPAGLKSHASGRPDSQISTTDFVDCNWTLLTAKPKLAAADSPPGDRMMLAFKMEYSGVYRVTKRQLTLILHGETTISSRMLKSSAAGSDYLAPIFGNEQGIDWVQIIVWFREGTKWGRNSTI